MVKSLEQSEQFREIFEKSPIGILFYDKKGILIDSNQSALEIARISQFSDIEGTNLFDNPYIESRKEELLKNGFIRFESPIDLNKVKELGFYTPTRDEFIYIDYTVSVIDSGFIAQIQDITRYKEAEEEVRDNEEKLRVLFENLPVGVSVLNAERKVIYDNPALEKIIGLSDEELKLGKYAERRYFNSDMTEISLDRLPSNKAFKEQAPVKEMEVGILKKDNSLIWTNVSAIPLKFPDWKMLLVTSNITDHKKAEEERMSLFEVIQAERDKLESLVNNIPDEVWFADINKKFTLVNPSALKEFNIVSPDVDVEEMAKNLEVYDIDGKVRPVDDAPPLKALKGDIVRNQEEIIRTPGTGELRYRQVNASPVKDSKGKIIGSVSVVRDITERKKAEEELDIQHQLLQMLIDKVPSAINLIRGSDMKIILVNPAYQAISPGKDIVGKTLNEVWPETQKDFIKLCRQVLTTGEPYYAVDDLNMISRSPDKSPEPAYFTWWLFPVDIPGEGKGILNVSIDTTERKKVEEALIQNQKLLQDIINGFPSPIFVKDVEGHFLIINNKLEELLGVKNEELMGKTDYNLFTKEVADYYRANDHRVIKEGRAITFEEEADLIDGHHVFVANKFPLYDIDGNPYGVGSVSTDITEIKRLQEELIQARDNLEEQVEERTTEIEEAYQLLKESELKAKHRANLLDITHEAIFVRDINDKITFWNKGAEELYGWSKKEALGKISHDLIKTDFPEPLEQIKIDVIKKGRWDGELIHTNRDGTKINVLSRWSLQGDKYEPKGFLEVNIDITERKKAEEAIKAERQRFTDVMEILPAYLILLKQDYHVEYANRFFRERFGEDCGKRCYEYLFGLDEPCENCETFKVLKTNAPHHWEWKGPDGRNYDIYDFPFIDTDGSQLIMEFGIDITERVKAEEQLKETITELERSNEELESFAYITSHDLQEPLRSIASYSQLIKRRYGGQLDSDADEFIDFMVAGAKRMKQQIQGLLEYSRVGTRGGDFWRFSSQKALNDALSNLSSAILECHADVSYDSLPSIWGDEAQITRVFQNLIGNALKFRKEGVTLRIHISATQKDDEYIFSVADNGIGLEEQYSDRIFEVFKRLHAIGEYEGAGIGLAIVKRIIDRHNGRIWAESELGKGSVFYFALPVEPVETGGGGILKI